MNPDQLDKQRAAGRVAWNFFEDLKKMMKPGLNLLEIEAFARESISQSGMKPAFLGYKGYPAVTCLSVNSAIVHGIPYDYALQDGDVVAVDIGVSNDGYLVDTARTYGVGTIGKEARQLLEVTSHALDQAIEVCRASARVGDIGAVVEKCVKDAGFAIIEELTGHGVGKTLQEEPSIPNHGRPGTGATLKEGMVVAIEPITALKPVRVVILGDGWTIAAREDVLSAHFEHTIALTAEGPVVLTDGS
jgi:methionyl aminopeptidase